MRISQISGKLVKLILTALILHNHGIAGANLAQFGLPPCCYVEPPPFLPASSQIHPTLDTVKGRTEEEERKGRTSEDAGDATTLEPKNTTESGEIQTFLFRMDFPEANASSSANKTKRTAAATPVQLPAELDLDKHKMPADWKTRLRRVLFQSVKENPPGTSRNKTSTKTEALWERIYSAPLQVIDTVTRREIPTHDAMDKLESVSLPAERISGVMVSTENGIELRTSEGMLEGATLENTGEESRVAVPPAGQCNCHLIQHGDTLLAYWSVGFSGNNLEYLVYPLPHNVPTPPIFESFHSEPILRPSPIDLNPLIASRSVIDEVPFQPSLEFGVTSPTAPHYAAAHAPGPLLPPPIANGLQFPPIGNDLQFGPVGNHLQYPPSAGGFPYFGFPPPPNFIGQEQFLGPNFGFGGYPPGSPPIYGQNMFQQAPIPPPPPLRKQADEEFLNSQPPLPLSGPGGNVIGPLDPFNPNHPKSIQEILFQGNLGGQPGFPGGQPPLDVQLPPGPNSGIYPPGFDAYPRQRPTGSGQNYPPPRDQVVRTRPPGIYINDPAGGRRPEDQPRDQPGNYNYRDRGISDRPTDYQGGYRKENERCYSSNCLERYGDAGQRGSRTGKGGYQYQSTNAKGKVRSRDGRKLKVKDGNKGTKGTTEPGYYLNF